MNIHQQHPNFSQHTQKLIQLARDRVKKGLRLKPGTYKKFIERMKSKNPQGNTEKHHIEPLHSGGQDISENIIILGVRDHINAHLLLYLERGNKGDFSAYIFRKASSHINLKTQGQKIAMLNRINKKGWFDSEVQRANGLRGGSIGGSKNTPAQFKAHSTVGKKWGQKVGKSNQSKFLQEQLASTLVFLDKDAPYELFYIKPTGSVFELAQALNKACDIRNRPDLKLDLDRVKKGGAWYNLIKQVKKSIYGWSIIQVISKVD